MTSRPSIALSAIVLAYRSEATVEQAVLSLVTQESTEPFEVILVASGVDRSATRVRRRFPEVRVIESTKRLYPGAARNAGLSEARGEIIAFLAADCVALAGWVEKRLAAHRSGHLAVASAVTNAGLQTPWAWAAHYFLYHERLCDQAPRRLAPPEPAAHGLSFDARLLQSLGPFPTTVRIGEDTAMARRLADAGVDVWFEPSVCSGHFGPRGMIAMLGDQWRRGARREAAEAAAWLDRPRTRLVRHFARTAARRVHRTCTQVWAAGRPHRLRLVICFPWLVAASCAYHLGRARQALQHPGAAPLTKSPHQGPQHTNGTARREGL